MTISDISLSVIDELVEHIRAFPDVHKITLYGSRARGTQTAASDIDIAVEGVTNPLEWLTICQLADVEVSPLHTLIKIDLVRFEEVDTAVQENIRKEGKLLYERH